MQKRRDFLKKLSITGGTMLLGSNLVYSKSSMVFSTNIEPEYTEAQLAFKKLEFGMFIHFGINTFNDKEWSYGDLPLTSFTATTIDTDQWCRAATKAGMKYLIFVTKHVDGFCNWPSSYTQYHIGNTVFKKDLLKQLIESAKKYQLKVGLYYCLWDENHASFKAEEQVFNAYVRNQVTELLTQYGEICCIWFDGFWKKQSSGWKRSDEKIEGEKIEKHASNQHDLDFIHAWRSEGAYRLAYDQLYLMIKRLQPQCIVFNNPTTAFKAVPLFPVDARCAEKGTDLIADQKKWFWLGKEVKLPLQIETTLSQKGDPLFPSGNWFWHSWDTSVVNLEQVNQWKIEAKRLDANLVLNVGPMSNGKLRNEDLELLMKLKE